MKKIITLSVFTFLFFQITSAQNIITNGSLESNMAAANMTGLTATWSSIVQDSWEVDGGSMDLITTNSCTDPSAGNWFVSTSPQSGLWPYLAFSLKFSSPIVSGVSYKLSLDKIYCGPNTSAIDIGLSNDSTLMGTFLHTFTAPLNNNWETDTFSFVNAYSYKYLAINVGTTGGTGVIGLDNFILTTIFSTSVNAIKETGKISFQNPVSDLLNIHFQNPIGKKTIELIDVSGRTVKSITADNENEISIDVKNISAGIYFLKVNNLTPEKVIVY